MTTIDAAALEKVLSSIDVGFGLARRVTLDAGGITHLASGAVWLVFVSGGSVHGQPPLAQACTLDVDRASSTVAVSPGTEREVLVEGDAFFTLGGQQIALRSERGASLMVAELQLSDTANAVRQVLPDFVTVTGFAHLEPAAAALARTLGPATPDAHALRLGNPVICRMMTTTVLLSVIRAWAENGCASTGWPSRSNDPFLDRVIDAIHEHPGREWTVESLAGVGAMSRSVFAARFHDALGRSPASYVTVVRMETAKTMLDDGRSVAATARELGYGSDEGFSRAFRRATGMTPSAWRARRREPVPA